MREWRLQGQEEYLNGVSLSLQNYKKYRDDWEHDHCEFCGARFSEQPGDLNVGYATSDYYRWVCEDCFEDFKCRFEWKVCRNGYEGNVRRENTANEPLDGSD